MRKPVWLLSLMLAACATTGPEERGILIETTSKGSSLPGTECTVSTAAGSWNILTPARVDVGEPSGDLRVLCKRQGFRTAETIHRGYAPAGAPSIGFGLGGGSRGVGASVGMSVPFGRAAVQYPSHIRVEMAPE